ncbi:hypothetical protein PR048_024590 [Dryococelus australis]|uniref:Uncharacterized protein n=1 Tax=Dryococelus australis TaxID=614101 RepID=A0ABQ9GP21_9NEOP|nr:hypothetical protein PR048_024590 [Dryococelus australis]
MLLNTELSLRTGIHIRPVAVKILLTSHQGDPGSIPRPGHSGIFVCGCRAERCRWSAGFLGDLPFPQSFHSGDAPYSPQSTLSVLKTPEPPKSLHSLAIWPTLNVEDLKADEGEARYEAAPEFKGGGKRETPEKTRLPAASSSTIPASENQGTTSSLAEPQFSHIHTKGGQWRQDRGLPLPTPDPAHGVTARPRRLPGKLRASSIISASFLGARRDGDQATPTPPTINRDAERPRLMGFSRAAFLTRLRVIAPSAARSPSTPPRRYTACPGIHDSTCLVRGTHDCLVSHREAELPCKFGAIHGILFYGLRLRDVAKCVRKEVPRRFSRRSELGVCCGWERGVAARFAGRFKAARSVEAARGVRRRDSRRARRMEAVL